MDVKELEEEIKKLEEKIVNEYNSLYSQDEKIYERLIQISSKYPDQEELLKFIIFLNDNLTTKQKKGHEIAFDGLTSIIDNKKKLLKLLDKPKKIPFWKKISLKDWKFLLFSGIFLILLFLWIFFPELRNDLKEFFFLLKKIV